MSDEQKDTKVDISTQVVGEVEMPKLDVDAYLGKDAKIEAVETHEGQYGYYVKVLSSSLGTFNDKPINASRVFGLVTLEDGKIGWGSESKLAGFLTKFGVSHYNELIGKDVKISKTQANADGEEFLTF